MARVGPTLFDRWSAVYDRPGFQNAIYRPVHDAVLARLIGMQPDTILDLGCGTGQLTHRLSEGFSDAQVVGIDYSAGMLDEARRRLGGGAHLVQADAHDLPIPPSSVDVVVCTESFHWYLDQRRALAGVAEILRPGGRLVVVSIAALTEFGEAAVRVWSTSRGRPVHAVSPRRMRRLVAGAGFQSVHQQRVRRGGLAPWPLLTDARRP